MNAARGTVRGIPNADGSVRWSLYVRRKGQPDYVKRFPQFTSHDDRSKVEAAAEPYRQGLARLPDRGAAPAGEAVQAWFGRYLEWRGKQPIGGESVADSRGRLKKWIYTALAGTFGAMAMCDVTATHLEDLVAELDDRVSRGELSHKTARNAWGEVTVGFDVASSAKRSNGLRILTSNPAKGVAGPDKGISKSKPFLRPDEVARLLSCADIPIERRQVYGVAIYTAIRQAELRAVRIRDVDLDAMQISVTKQLKSGVEKERTKSGRGRTVTIEPNLVPLLRVLIEGRPSDARLLSVRAHNRCASTLREDLTLAGCKREALHVPKSDKQRAHLTFHNLRDTCLTHMAVRRDPPQDVQWRAGHTTPDMTERYIANARHEAGPAFGTPLGPLPTCLIHPDEDAPGDVIADVIVRSSEPRNSVKRWRRRESKTRAIRAKSRAMRRLLLSRGVIVRHEPRQRVTQCAETISAMRLGAGQATDDS